MMREDEAACAMRTLRLLEQERIHRSLLKEAEKGLDDVASRKVKNARQVLLSAKPSVRKARARAGKDPIVLAFLHFLEWEMQARPGDIVPADEHQLRRIGKLVADVKAGSKTDVYEAFRRMLARGEVPDGIAALLKQSRER